MLEQAGGWQLAQQRGAEPGRAGACGCSLTAPAPFSSMPTAPEERCKWVRGAGKLRGRGGLGRLRGSAASCRGQQGAELQGKGRELRACSWAPPESRRGHSSMAPVQQLPRPLWCHAAASCPAPEAPALGQGTGMEAGRGGWVAAVWSECRGHCPVPGWCRGSCSWDSCQGCSWCPLPDPCSPLKDFQAPSLATQNPPPPSQPRPPLRQGLLPPSRPCLPSQLCPPSLGCPARWPRAS